MSGVSEILTPHPLTARGVCTPPPPPPAFGAGEYALAGCRGGVNIWSIFRFYTETESFDVSIEPKQTEGQPKQFNREHIFRPNL
jgi:hypothetical protein